MPLKASRVVRVNRRLAESIILRYEWLGTMGSSSYFYGLMFGDRCAGVCCVAKHGGGTAGPTTGHRFGLVQAEVAILARGACVHWAPPGANSRLVSLTTKLLVRDAPGHRIMMAYSDSEAGEIGTIYQACGWTYVGKTRRGKDSEIVSPSGRVVNSQTVGHWARKNGIRYSDYQKLLIRRGWRPQVSNPKGIYVKQLVKGDDLLAARLRDMSLPYPKRAASIGLDAPGHQPGEGGQ